MHEPDALPIDEARGRPRFLRLAFALTMLGLALRLFYLWAAQVDAPIRGDVLGYWNYAWNLADHATFSGSKPDGGPIAPDSFRGPGYPLFLALCIKVAGVPEHALRVAQIAQVFVGTALVPLAIILARSWLERPAALVAGLLVALWPHLIVFSSTLLSETVFGFTLLSMVLLTDLAQRRNSEALAVSSGLMAGLAHLVNPVVMFFPVAVACLLAARGQVRTGAGLMLGFALVAGGWGLRNASLPESAGTGHRASINLVQGSWPLYHAAHNDESINETARAVADAIREEERLMLADPAAGWSSMRDRFDGDPKYYLTWYLLQKPYLLWDWRVRIGWGDVYFLETRNSPFERNAGMRAIHTLFRWLNPLVFLLAVAGALAYLILGVRRRSTPFAPLVVAGFFVYITAVHTVFQAEPRYSVAYRPFEILLAVAAAGAALTEISAWFRRRQNGQGPSAP